LRASSFFRAVASLAVAGALVTVADASAQASSSRSVAPHATEHQSLRGRSIIPHVIKRGVIHNWPPAKVKVHDQVGIGCRRCLLPGKLRIEPPQPMTSF